ncbi:unnamed protein product [Calicophoron daubneyi]|uniref:Tetraspanin n=1 Tax=Calicophoron daubneyi TaxID=300641 RepID=A0AAV2TL65_CALDB
MALTCGQKCARILLIIWNVILVLFGIGVIVVGSLALASLDKYGNSEENYLRAFCIFVIVLGCYLFVVGFFGFCGAVKKNTCCLTIYCILVGIFILAGIAGAIAGFVLRNKVKESVEKTMTQLYGTYSSNTDAQKLIDTIQKDLQCCGPNGTWPSGQGNTPSSCNNDSGSQYTDGCTIKLEDFFKKYMLAIGLCLILFALVLIFGIVFAVCVINGIKNDETA